MSREYQLNTKKLKVNTNNSSPTIVNLLSQGTVSYQVSDQYEQNSAFYSIISDIMRGFGDAAKPLRESVMLVEKILTQQMRGIMQDIFDISMRRRGKCAPSKSDFEFLMRKDPVKVLRLRKHLRDIKLQKKYENLSQGRDIQESLENLNDNSDDEIEDDMELHDEVKVRRLFRADRISQVLTGEEYVEYNIARRVSFYSRNVTAMRARMKFFLNVPMDIQLSPMTLNILAYLAHETIAILVDYCILTRLNSSNRSMEPYSRVTTPGVYYKFIIFCYICLL